MSDFIVVTGATGRQGGAVARALAKAGAQIRALVRDPSSPRAWPLTQLGIPLVQGDLDEPESLKAALDGAYGIFSLQTPDLTGREPHAEVRRAVNLAEAAAVAGVRQVVHTSVSGVSRPVDKDRWGAAMAHYWKSKAAAEAALRDVRAQFTTMVRPSTFLESFQRPSPYFADRTSDRLLVACDPDAPRAFVAVDDIGAAAAAAFADPPRFNGVELELAGAVSGFRQIAAILSTAWNADITLTADPAEARAAGLPEPFALLQEHLDAHPAPARPEYAHALGLHTTTIEEWARTRR
ncbi:NmrA family NAD(P)-binding protein [Streptomyces solisilvae]|uniref:NmrA family NAD(P)-binding protein n=1 Tax=Streptomyces malaysiensis TaxID=92644 RepID=UPI0033284377